MELKKQSRNAAMDILRCFALLGVVSLHFFKHSGYYYKLVIGARMYILTILRSASMVSVPLFLMLSGYLLKNRQPNRQYYSKLVRTVGIYVLASICCYLYRYFTGAKAVSGSIGELVAMILSFRAAPYAWYVEMYIGLFLLIPFLNVLYNNLESRKRKQQLLLILMIMTAFPGITNGVGEILPDWWLTLYPVMYYYFGAYLREYPLKMKTLTNFACTAAVVLAVGIVNILISYNTSFVLGPWQEEGAFLNVIQSVFVFNFLMQRRYTKLSVGASKLFARLSDLSLGAYLVSWIFDDIFYSLLDQIQPVVAYKLEYYPLVITVICACSLGLSAVINLVYQLAAKLTSSVAFRNTRDA